MSRRKAAFKDVERKLCFMRCFEECLNSIRSAKSFPKAIAFEPSEINYKINFDFEMLLNESDVELNICLFDELIDDLNVYEAKQNEFKKSNNSYKHIIDPKTIVNITTNSVIEINSLGHWIQIVSITVRKTKQNKKNNQNI